MATRFYMGDANFTAATTTHHGGWGSSVADHEYLQLEATNPSDMSFVLESYTGMGAGTRRFRTFISEEMSGGLVFNGSTTWTWVCRYGQSSSSADTFSLFHIAIISDDGNTLRAEFSAKEKDGTEVVTSTGTPSSRTNMNTGGIVYTTVAGDRIQLEVGWDQDGSGSYTQVVSRGNNSGTDLSSTDGDTDIQNPWMECSTTITFGGGDPPPPATDEDWTAQFFLSGFLDEWV